jgi:hypothetical protein
VTVDTEEDAATRALERASQIVAERKNLPVEDGRHLAEDGWPELDEAAWHGPAGEYARAADSYTEADSVAVLVTILSASGACIGNGPHLVAGNDRHTGSVWPVLVGQTAKGAKGTSWGASRAALRHADPVFFGTDKASRVLSGFNSGESVVDAIRDPDENDPEDAGADDKRLLVYEPEFARLLRAAARDGSTLSMLLRDGWDGGMLQTRARSKVAIATDYHLVTLGHITAEELRRRLDDTESYGGFSNRFLWVCVRRSGRHPEGGNVPEELAERWGAEIRTAIARSCTFGQVQRTEAAKVRWAEVYEALGNDTPGGLLGAVTARAEPMTLRLSLLYALLDGRDAVDVPHVEAAFALWRYSRASAAYVFGESLGDPQADILLAAICQAGVAGLDGTAQRDLFGRHLPGKRLEALRKLLKDRGLIVTIEDKTGGRTRIVSFATKATKGQTNRLNGGVRSPTSLSSQDDNAPLHSDNDFARHEAVEEEETSWMG